MIYFPDIHEAEMFAKNKLPQKFCNLLKAN